jgi:hypothetical protein
MSLLIKGMKMPKCCSDCAFYQDDMYPACKFLWDDFDNYRHPAIERDKNCPLSEIPTPHGDLIDRDDLLAYFERKSKGKTAEEALKLLYTALKAYPTVIEKEMN